MIRNAGDLTISDSAGEGEIHVKGYPVGVFGNTGKLTINSGKFTNEVSDANSEGKKNVYYMLNNNGEVYINGGSFVSAPETDINSSIIKNGWYSTSESVGSNDLVAFNSEVKAIAEIKNATFSGSTYVKNDTNGSMTIFSGSFVNMNQNGRSGECVYNGGNLIVKGGSFDLSASEEAMGVFLIGSGIQNAGTSTVIEGGVYKFGNNYAGSTGDAPLICISGEAENPGDIMIQVSSDTVKAIGKNPVAKTALFTGDNGKTKYDKVGQVELSVAGSSVSVSGFGDIAEGNMPTFTYADGKLVVDQLNMETGNSYVSGKVQIDGLSLTGTLVVSKNADVTLPEGTAGANIVNLGGTIKSNDGKVIDATKEVVDVGNDPAELERALLNATVFGNSV